MNGVRISNGCRTAMEISSFFGVRYVQKSVEKLRSEYTMNCDVFMTSHITWTTVKILNQKTTLWDTDLLIIFVVSILRIHGVVC